MTQKLPLWNSEVEERKTDHQFHLDFLEEIGLIKKENDKFEINDQKFKEFLFAVFSVYFLNEKMLFYKRNINLTKEQERTLRLFRVEDEKIKKYKKQLREEFYSLIGASNKTLLIGQFNGIPLTPIKNLYNPDLNGLGVGNGDKDFCPMLHFVLHYLASMVQENKIKKENLNIKDELFSFSCSSKNCINCKRDLIYYLWSKVKKEDDTGKLFGGNGIEINIPPEFLKVYLADNSEWYDSNKGLERAYNILLSIYLGLKYQFKIFSWSDDFQHPHSCNEIDVRLLNDNIMIILENTTKLMLDSNEIGEYIQTKIDNLHKIENQTKIDNVKLIIIAPCLQTKLIENANHTKFSSHLDYKDIRFIGYNDTTVEINDQKRWTNNGFIKLKIIFNEILDNLEAQIIDLK